MFSLIFSNIGYLLTGVLAFTVYRCAKANTTEAFFVAVTLCLLALPAWMESWSQPQSMAAAHFGVLFFVLITLYNGFLKPISLTVMLMLLADVLCAIHVTASNQPLTIASLFYWQSALNLLFLFQCVYTIRKCGKIAFNNKGKRQGSRHNGFFAKTILRDH